MWTSLTSPIRNRLAFRDYQYLRTGRRGKQRGRMAIATGATLGLFRSHEAGLLYSLS